MIFISSATWFVFISIWSMISICRDAPPFCIPWSLFVLLYVWRDCGGDLYCRWHRISIFSASWSLLLQWCIIMQCMTSSLQLYQDKTCDKCEKLWRVAAQLKDHGEGGHEICININTSVNFSKQTNPQSAGPSVLLGQKWNKNFEGEFSHA